jgi:hypothetical protein
MPPRLQAAAGTCAVLSWTLHCCTHCCGGGLCLALTSGCILVTYLLHLLLCRRRLLPSWVCCFSPAHGAAPGGRFLPAAGSCRVYTSTSRLKCVVRVLLVLGLLPMLWCPHDSGVCRMVAFFATSTVHGTIVNYLKGMCVFEGLGPVSMAVRRRYFCSFLSDQAAYCVLSRVSCPRQTSSGSGSR